jgi:hypothetical protein
MVWALVNEKSVTVASTDEKKLTGQLVDFFITNLDTNIMVHEMLQYDTKPIELLIAKSR